MLGHQTNIPAAAHRESTENALPVDIRGETRAACEYISKFKHCPTYRFLARYIEEV